MLGFTCLTLLYYYLRSRSPGPPFLPARPLSGRGDGGQNGLKRHQASSQDTIR
jgi:hypothetical protein